MSHLGNRRIMYQHALLGGGAGGGGYTAQGVRFNGATWFKGPTNTPFTGATPSKKGTTSFWFRMQGGDGSFGQLFESDKDNLNRWNYINASSDSSAVASLFTSSTFVASGATWHHLFSTFDETGAPSGAGDILIDGVSVIGGFSQAGSPTDVDYAGAKTLTLGARNGGSLLLNADIADLYINWGTYLNPATELSKFRNPATGRPVDLGVNGSIPTGSAHIGFFSGAVANWHQNKGTGGDIFTLQAGGLTASSSNP
jgi:hypothetical protein